MRDIATKLLNPLMYVARNEVGELGLDAMHVAAAYLKITTDDADIAPMNARISELESALKLCLHVLENGIEVSMDDRWPTLFEPLRLAKEAAKKALA